MTDTAKSNILKYISGKIVPETEINVPYGQNFDSFSNTIWSDLEDYFGEGNFSLASKFIQNLNGDMIIGYGYYGGEGDYSSGTRSFIVLTNIKFEVIKIIDEYNTGTTLGLIQYLTIDENGQFYGIDLTTNYRFILLNNFTIKSAIETEYVLRLRKSYTIDNADISLFNSTNASITKKNGESKYIIVAPKELTSGYIRYVNITQFTINVGAENEWITDTYDLTIGLQPFLDSYCEWSGDVFTVKFCGINRSSTNFVEYTKVSTGSISYIQGISDMSESPTAKILSLTKTYISYLTFSDESSTSNIAVYNNGSENIIYTNEDIYSSSIFLKKQDNEIFFYKILFITATNYNFSVFHIINDIANKLFDSRVYSEITTVMLVKQYNLYTHYSYNVVTGESYLAKEIYNSLNYNGLPYESENFLIPSQAILYDESDIPIYARNLYNVVTDGNSTVSTLQVGNTYLNDVTIADKDLIGETNQTLIKNSTLLAKNIYENVLINFYNNIYMKKGIVYNTLGAIKLNESFNQDDQYDNAKITKYKLIYDDDSYDIRNVDTITITDGIADIEMYFYVHKELVNIQILSADETTVYCEIPMSGINKYFKVNQKVEVI